MFIFLIGTQTYSNSHHSLTHILSNLCKQGTREHKELDPDADTGGSACAVQWINEQNTNDEKLTGSWGKQGSKPDEPFRQTSPLRKRARIRSPINSKVQDNKTKIQNHTEEVTRQDKIVKESGTWEGSTKLNQSNHKGGKKRQKTGNKQHDTWEV